MSDRKRECRLRNGQSEVMSVSEAGELKQKDEQYDGELSDNMAIRVVLDYYGTLYSVLSSNGVYLGLCLVVWQLT